MFGPRSARRGFNAPVVRRGFNVSGAPSDPIAGLFPSGGIDGYYNLLDLDNIFTTSDGATNAVINDPVGLVNATLGTGITVSSPVSAERPILRETAGGVRYLQFLSTSRITFNFGSPFVGAMWVSTLAGSYVVEINSATTFVWGQFMPVRDVTGIIFVEGYDIQTAAAERVRKALVSVTGGQLEWDANRTSFAETFRAQRLSKITARVVPDNIINAAWMFRDNPDLAIAPDGLFANKPNLSRIDATFSLTVKGGLLTVSKQLIANSPNLVNLNNAWTYTRISNVPGDLLEDQPDIENMAGAFSFCDVTEVGARIFDNQTVCINYASLFRYGGNALTPQSVENVLVSIAYSANTNNLNNGALGIRGNGSNLTAAAETARQQLLARGWVLTLDNITGL